MDQSKTIWKLVIVRKENNMIINENNKNTILQGMVKRGLNQDPNELREKLYQANLKTSVKKEEPKPVKDIQKNVRETFEKLRRLP